MQVVLRYFLINWPKLAVLCYDKEKLVSSSSVCTFMILNYSVGGLCDQQNGKTQGRQLAIAPVTQLLTIKTLESI